MAGSTAGIPGKHIYELDELKLLKASAVFAVAQDNLTRRVNLDDLRLAFNGDSSEASTNTYYSTEYMERKFSDDDERFRDVTESISNTNDRIDRLTEYVNEKDNILLEKINENYNYWDEKLYNTSTGDIVVINRNIEAIDNRVDVLEEKLKNITAISYGTAAPTSLKTGEIYLQYF